ncbi:oligosaccharide flippase family protein [Pseudomonas sp. HY7a-MNA-CIBAN-0227]|uniref:lipopolysaccharide biosynthesis protein n=1 Tax=Pseudomonas sp. HY7a-MNA-CIBAN-0227 TaxID=3140474 RepID=UPI003318CC0E
MLQRFLPKSAFAKNVITLMTGTSIAQAIPIAITPILSRLYTPEDFGIFAFYMAVAAIFSVLVTGRYELAIILPEKDSDAINIVALSIALSCILSAIILLVVVIFNSQITIWLKPPSASEWLYFIPLSTLFMGIYQSLNYWSNRKGHYRRMALSRMAQSGSAVSGQLGAGYLGMASAGMVLGQLLGQVVSTTLLGRSIYREDKRHLNKVSRQEVFSLSKKYSSFPKYLVLGQLANVASSQMPLLLLSVFFGPAVAGFYSLSEKTLLAPMTLVGGAIGDVFRSEAALSYKKNGNCRDLFLNTVVKLTLFATIPVLPVYFFGPWLFSFVFGGQWRASGEIASIISIMVFFQAISSPLSQTVLLAGMQAVDLAWQIARLLFSVGSFFLGYMVFEDYKLAIIFHVVSFSVLYVMHSILQYYAAKGSGKIYE